MVFILSPVFLVCALNVKHLVMAALVPQQQLGEGAVLLALLSKIPPLPSVQPLAEAHSALTLLSCVFF